MTRWLQRFLVAVNLVAAVVVVSACRREDRSPHVRAPAAATTQSVRLSDLVPGASTTPSTVPAVHNEYEENAYAMSEGKRLYSAFNCVGCHGHGGGGMGPPLMDDKWIYGSSPEQVHASIVQGRPNGMPAWGSKIPDYQIWQLVAYVRSLSGLTSKDAAPSRDDHMQAKPPENSTPTTTPVNSSVPKSTEMPE